MAHLGVRKPHDPSLGRAEGSRPRETRRYCTFSIVPFRLARIILAWSADPLHCTLSKGEKNAGVLSSRLKICCLRHIKRYHPLCEYNLPPPVLCLVSSVRLFFCRGTLYLTQAREVSLSSHDSLFGPSQKSFCQSHVDNCCGTSRPGRACATAVSTRVFFSGCG